VYQVNLFEIFITQKESHIMLLLLVFFFFSSTLTGQLQWDAYHNLMYSLNLQNELQQRPEGIGLLTF